jgi:hypothetical protein
MIKQKKVYYWPIQKKIEIQEDEPEKPKEEYKHIIQKEENLDIE